LRVLVTGAGGFVARHVIAALRNQEHTPIPAYHHAPSNPPDGFVSFSIEDPAAARTAIRQTQPDAIVNCAAYSVDHGQQDLALAVTVNVLGPAQLFIASRDAGVGRFVQVGTGYEYGSHDLGITEETDCVPVGTYGASKAAGSLVLMELGRRLGQAPVLVRPFSMYGPGEAPSKLVPQVVDAVVTDAELDLTEGRDLRDYMPVGDVARAIAALATIAEPGFPYGDVFNICSGRSTTIRELVQAVAAAAGGTGRLRFGALPSRSDALLRVVGDPSRWRAFCDENGMTDVLRETPLAEVIKRMIDERRR
jgi:nucleoside-diphosphate-sugar epimerase